MYFAPYTFKTWLRACLPVCVSFPVSDAVKNCWSVFWVAAGLMCILLLTRGWGDVMAGFFIHPRIVIEASLVKLAVIEYFFYYNHS